MTAPVMLRTADAVFAAESALRRAAEVVDELGDVAASSLRVLDDAAVDSFHARREERRDTYVESAGEHLDRLRNRSEVMRELGEELARHIDRASGAVDRVGAELEQALDGVAESVDVEALRMRVAALREVVTLAGPMVESISAHAFHAAEAAQATDALMLLDNRVHEAGREVSRADEGVSMMRTVLDHARTHAQDSATLASSLSRPGERSQQMAPPRPRDAGPGLAI
ncbi:hypothetical protein [Nocardioides lacusdianchii]|uniref:hypothetical protein n=1 Tax=Nocardioides lacusdianchii TaxID=2783664 RepID=UPI001CCF9A5C|nr:hypothetical protein [Nocardioides lacusdianchii]